MAKQKRRKTNYAGVFYIESLVPGTKKSDRIYYIRYRRNGKLVEEKAGRQSTNDMTPARASGLRADRLEGKQLSNIEVRQEEKAALEAELSKWTIKKLWEQYKANKSDLKGLVTDENRFTNYIDPTFGEYEPCDIDFLSLERFKSKLRKTHSLRGKNKKGPLLSPGSIKNILELLNRIINYGSKNNLCDGINFTITMPKYDSEKTEDLTPNQLSSLLKAIEKSDHQIAASMMLMALYSGMRRSEMFKLEWFDIDFDRGFILLRDPKGIKNQNIPLNDSARKVLEKLPRTSDFVFPGRHGGQRVDIKNAVNKIKEEAGIPKGFRALHGLRHVFASMLASSGQVDMYTLQKLLTHKSPQMTQRYAHLRDEALQRASNLAGDIISNVINENKEEEVSN